MRAFRCIVLPAAVATPAVGFATAHRHELLLGLLLAAVACGGRLAEDSTGNNGAGGAGVGGAVGQRGGATGSGGAGAAAGAGETGAGGDTGGWAIGGSTGAGAASGAAAASGYGGYSGTGGQGGGDWTACGAADTCVLEAVSCCGPPCEPVPLSAFTAINLAGAAEYWKVHPPCPCILSVCPTVAPEERNIPSYAATCEQGQCKAIDIRTSALTACTDSSDCYLRSGTNCCVDCTTDNMVAFSLKADVQTALCGVGPVACPAIGCDIALPVGLVAVCDSSSHCVAIYPQVVDAGAATQ